MNIDEFVIKRPYLYHLTDKNNLEFLKKTGGVLHSTLSLVEKSQVLPEQQGEIVRKRRPIHVSIKIDGHSVAIRDQGPISEKNLLKCIPKGWGVADFLLVLNERVFFWPTLNRLKSHYDRYEEEEPIIIRVGTGGLFQINPEPLFCRLNSGATRSNSYLNGAPPSRDRNSFLPADQFELPIRDVAEVTFLKNANLPREVQIGKSPQGPWENLKFK